MTIDEEISQEIDELLHVIEEIEEPSDDEEEEMPTDEKPIQEERDNDKKDQLFIYLLVGGAVILAEIFIGRLKIRRVKQ